jgi:transposase
MEHYVGLDMSLKLTSICIVDRTGKVEREGMVASDPEAIATFIKLHALYVVRIGFETGATSTWLWTELNTIGLPVICIDARHAKAVLKMQINKSDRNDAAGKRVSCNVVGTRRFASKISIVMRPKLFLAVELFSSRSSGISKIKSGGSSRIVGSSSDEQR